eukprot:augustus_masked-scaffold_42-processed-gene-2.64-mRNA-1 protein AED:1.00 eAED:1.00 QI:0/-1/0/0/-1/1/1/0/267
MLKGRTGIITGAAGGIGAESARKFVANGAKLTLIDLDLASLQELKNEIDEEYPNFVQIIKADIGSVEEVKGFIQNHVKKFSSLDFYFSNAGILNPLVEIWEESEEMFLKTLKVNTFGNFLAIKYASEQMLNQTNECSILCTGSIAALSSDLTPLQYAASKGGVLSMMRTANDRLLGTNVRVNGIAPGGVMTEMYMKMAQDLVSRGYEMKHFDLTRFPPIEPAAIADVACFLASDMSRAVKGHMLVADGGMSACMTSQVYPKKKKSKL